MQLNLCTALSLLAFCVLGENTTPVMEELLKTNQFLVVGVSGCRITFETDFSERTCGMYLTDNTTVSESVCNWTSIVPLSEPYEDSMTPMKLLFFGHVDKKQVMFIRSLEFPKEKHQGHRFHSVNVLDGAVDVSLPCPEYVLKRAFYYFDASDKDGQSSISSVSMDVFWALVQSKNSGVKERDFSTKPNSVSVSGGALIATYHTNSSDTQTIIPLSDLSEGIRCQHTNITPGTLFVVRDWEFCKLRDGERANATSCTNENPWRRTSMPTSSPSQEVEEETTFISLTSFIVVIAAVVVVALICVIAYKRRWRYETVGKTKQIHTPYPQFTPDVSYDF
ncbi:hypothetical protein QR680_004934 [Steinernema hermaphroditum]|uniref:Uncharacterized protein n=1 Tax=Steinernema hermaphroditum TaxID=289476 RepID=A0AA39HRD6_9BILA|nr:hypothetical protein QR680_004934 [Steinernema hermaphroditum]